MQLVNTFIEICKKNGKKIKLSFARMLKIFTLIFASCENFYNNSGADLLKKSKKSSQIKKSFIKYFRILKKNERRFSCTVNNQSN